MSPAASSTGVPGISIQSTFGGTLYSNLAFIAPVSPRWNVSIYSGEKSESEKEMWESGQAAGT